MAKQLKRFLENNSGATAIEYCFIASLVAMAIVTGLTTVGGKLKNIFVMIAAVN